MRGPQGTPFGCSGYSPVGEMKECCMAGGLTYGCKTWPKEQNKTGCPVKFEFHINNVFLFFSAIMSQILHEHPVFYLATLFPL